MKKIMRAFLAALCVLMLFNFSSAAEEKTWQDVFFLKEDGRDMNRLRRAMAPEDSFVQKDMKRVLEEKSKLEGKDAAVDYSKVFISYDISMEALLEYYENGETDLGYDGLPDSDWLSRNICVPIFRMEKLQDNLGLEIISPTTNWVQYLIPQYLPMILGGSYG